MGQGCDPNTEYNAFSGNTETVHATYSDFSGGTKVQWGTVLLGGNGVFN